MSGHLAFLIGWADFYVLHPVTWLLISVLLILSAIRLWSTRGRTRLPLILAGLSLMAFLPASLPFPVAFTNANLQSYDALAGAWPVLRLGFSVPGDAPALWYFPSGSACSLNSGGGDNGSQVEGANGKCWLADFGPGNTVDVREFGFIGGGVTDNSTAEAAVMNYMTVSGGGIVSLPPTKNFYFSSFTQIAPFTRLTCNVNPSMPAAASTNTSTVTGGALILGSSTDVSANVGTELDHCYLIASNLTTTPATNAAAQTMVGNFTGTGYYVPSAAYDSRANDLIIVGFQYPVHDNSSIGRTYLDRVKVDGTNGFLIDGATSDIYNWTSLEAGNFTVPDSLIPSNSCSGSGCAGFQALYRSGAALLCNATTSGDNTCSAVNIRGFGAVAFQTGIDLNGSQGTIYNFHVSQYHIDSYCQFSQYSGGPSTVGIRTRSTSGATGQGVSAAAFTDGETYCQAGGDIVMGAPPSGGRMSATFQNHDRENGGGLSIASSASFNLVSGYINGIPIQHVVTYQPGNPLGTTSTSFVAMGLGQSFVANSPNVVLTMQGTLLNSSGSYGVIQLFVASSAPTNGAAVAPNCGTNSNQWGSAVNTVTITCTMTGLSPGSTYYADLAVESGSGANTVTLANIQYAKIDQQ